MKIFLYTIVIVLFSCKNESPSTTTNENYFHELGLKESYSLGDFVLTIPEGAVARQKMIPAPRFLQARFAELGIVPPKEIQITYWKNHELRTIEILKIVRFLDYSNFDTINFYDMNKSTRISFANHFADSIENGLQGFCDYFGEEIKIEQWYGAMSETNTFLKIGNRTLYMKSSGNRDSDYQIFLDDSLITKGYAENIILFYNIDSLKNQILQD